VTPCDLSETMDIHYWNTHMRQPGDMKWAMAPRAPLQSPFFAWPTDDATTGGATATAATTQPVELDEAGRLTEYYLLPGYLFKWVFLYHQLPANDSWVWSIFPDGPLWRHRAAVYGTQVMDVQYQ
jgi:hypothetical protein